MNTMNGFTRMRILAALVLVLASIAVVLAPSAALAQGSDGIPILLGEYVQGDFAEGEARAYAVYVPESGAYMITSDDEEAAAAFSVVVSAAGDTIFEGALLNATELSLAEGIHLVEVTANADSTLGMFVLGMIGTMSDSDRTPGRLYPGSLYMEERVSESRYATLSIPNVGYPQQVLLYIDAVEEDVFSLSAEGDDIGYRYAYSNDQDLLGFWTEGGDYLITVDPWERRSDFSLIVFLSGAPALLPLDEALDGNLVAGNDTIVYELDLDTFYDSVQVKLEGGDEENPLYITVVDSLYSTVQQFYSEQDDDAQIVNMESVLPGTYYVAVSRYGVEDEAPFTLYAEGVEGEPLGQLENEETVEGEIAADATVYYQFEVTQPGALVDVVLASEVEEADFDLAVGLNLQNLPWSSASLGVNEQVSFMAPAAGTYFVQVTSYSGEGPFELTATEGDLATELVTGEVTEGSVDDDARVVYRLIVDEPGQILSVLLVGGDESDLDLSVNLYGETGDIVNGLSSASLGSSEIVAQADAQTGMYEVTVRAYGDGDDFRILARLESAEDLLEIESE
ncbi:MAG: PPC domain-containing protein [Caldilineaceae bacterium]|nr:PPC domain-containing protein [Caldilineaceae bacterium]